MSKLEASTQLTPEEVGSRAIEFFGPDGYGLTYDEHPPNRISFEGAGATLELETASEPSGGTAVTIETREWEYQAQKFLREFLEDGSMQTVGAEEGSMPG